MTESKPKHDPFVEIEQAILAQFELDSAPAREKRDQALAHVQFLRENYGNSAGISFSGELHLDVVPTLPSARRVNGNGTVTLKRAMIEAINVIKTDITRKRVLDWSYGKYPHLKGSKDGTIASTFSRVKRVHLEKQDDDNNLFKQKEVASDE
jgi:hypothetical protein